MFPHVVERQIRPALLRQLWVEAGVSEIDQVAVDILRRAQRIGAGEFGEVHRVRAGDPARHVDAGLLDRGVDAVLGLEPPS